MTGFYVTGEVATGSTGNAGTSTPVSTVTGVAVTPSTATLAGGGTVDFDWVIAGTNGPSQGATVTTTIGTINSAGVLTAPAATSSVQSGTVTVTSTQDPTKSGTATFTVAALVSTVTGVTVTPNPLTLAGGATTQFSAVVAGTNSPSQAGTWSTTIGSINSSGLFTAPAGTSSAQTGAVKFTSTQDSTKSDTAAVTVSALADTTGPVMQGVIAATQTATTTTIAWDPATDASGIGEYFYRKDGGALVSTGLNRTASFTGLTPLTAHLYEVSANDTFGNPSSNSISLTVVTDAASTDPTLVSKTITVTLKSHLLSLQANVAGINWTWSDARGTVTSSGTGLVASAAGVLLVPIKTRLLTDAVGFLTLDNYTGGNPLTYFGTAAWVRVP